MGTHGRSERGRVDVAVLAVELLDPALKGANLAALDSEDFEKFVPETLGVSVLALDMPPLAGKRPGTVGDFIPVERHGLQGSCDWFLLTLGAC